MNNTELAGRAMLVSLTISVWGNTKKDSEITRETLKRHHASDDAGRFTKTLLPKTTLQPITQYEAAWRKWHRKQTLPWFDEGQRIITATHFKEYSERAILYARRFEEMADAFAAQYPALVELAPARLQGMFRTEDYPAPEEIRERFSCKVTYAPVPLSKDFRVELSEEQLEGLKSDYEASVNGAVEAAKLDVAKRLAEPLARMAHILQKSETDRTSIRTPLVQNLRDAVCLVPSLRLDNDERFTALVAEADRLADVDVTLLRSSAIARRDTAKAAAEIQAKLQDYFGTKN